MAAGEGEMRRQECIAAAKQNTQQISHHSRVVGKWNDVFIFVLLLLEMMLFH
jgi:hypothetical protein